jgi:hypothetical protein
LNQTKSISQYAAGSNWQSGEAQSNKSTPPKFGAPYPFTADQLREMLLKVAAIKKVSEDGAEILEIFQLPRDEFLHAGAEELSTGVKGYNITAGKNWYFNMAFHFDEKSNNSQYFFSWGENPAEKRAQLAPEPPIGLCINSQTLIEQLKLSGWKRTRKTDLHEFPQTEIYVKDDFVALQLSYFQRENCVLRFNLFWDISLLRDLVL